MARVKRPAGTGWDALELAPVILISAGEDVIGEQACDRLIALALEREPGTEITKLDAATYIPGRLPMLASPSLFGEARVILVGNGEAMNDAFLKDSIGYVGSPEHDVVLIVRHKTSSARGKRLYDAIVAAGFQHAQIPAIKRDAEKAELVKEQVRRRNRSMTSGAVQDLVDALGKDVRELLSAVHQLLDDVPGRIDEKAVHTYHAGRNEATPFAVADAVIAGQAGRAVALSRHAMSTGTAAVPIVAAIASKLRAMGLHLASRGRAEPDEIKLAPWQLNRARDDMRGWSQEGLAHAILAVAQADAEVKGASRSPEFAVERLILRVGRARRLPAAVHQGPNVF